jgi:putative oxidoreductase
MAYAYFTVHQSRALLPIQNGGEASVMFCWAFLLIAFFGPGPWSLSELIGRFSHGANDRHEVTELDAMA